MRCSCWKTFKLWEPGGKNKFCTPNTSNNLRNVNTMPIRERQRLAWSRFSLSSEYTQWNSQLSLLFISYSFLHRSQPRYGNFNGVVGEEFAPSVWVAWENGWGGTKLQLAAGCDPSGLYSSLKHLCTLSLLSGILTGCFWKNNQYILYSNHRGHPIKELFSYDCSTQHNLSRVRTSPVKKVHIHIAGRH